MLDGGVERAQVVAHQLVQRSLFRAAPRVRWLGGHHRCPRKAHAPVRSAGVSLLPTAPGWRRNRSPAAAATVAGSDDGSLALLRVRRVQGSLARVVSGRDHRTPVAAVAL
jgi:hypothetical protein